jgi:hypothetical protein
LEVIAPNEKIIWTEMINWLGLMIYHW